MLSTAQRGESNRVGALSRINGRSVCLHSDWTAPKRLEAKAAAQLTPDDVDRFHQLGQRVSLLTYNTRNLIGNGSTERHDDGISDFGITIIERMNQIRMAVDVAHCGDRTTLEAFEISKAPVLITHANCRA